MERLERYITFISDLLTLDDINILIKDKGLYTLNKQPLNAKQVNVFSKYISGEIKGKVFVKNDEYYLFINLDKHNDDEYLTIAHELRHIYQLQSCNNQIDIEDENIINIWKSNLDNYKGANNINYEYQPIEQDANAFTSLIAKKVFNREIYIKSKNPEFEKWYKKIENDFSDDEINECLEYSNFIATQSPNSKLI